MFILKKGHQPGVYVPLRALFLVVSIFNGLMSTFCTPNFKDLASFCSCTGQYVSYMVKSL